VTRVVVDPERCVGSGTCEALAPAVFEVGDDGITHVLRAPGAADLAEVREAVGACPTQALTLVD